MDEEGNYYDYGFESAAVVTANEYYGPPAPYVDMQAEADYQARLAEDLSASSQSGVMAQASLEYAARLAADLAKIGLSAAVTSPTVRTVTASPAYQTGAAILSGARPAATVSTTFDWKEALVGVAVLAGIVVVVKAL
ncbi:MAG: hypothetical protein A3E01_09420 [Gammaproteobacteria bacterium RIFCSPHIGHO2_12_FULL_63_22]|nr:MAG: hypothetical protein A3E01_09420 [Gammaproteobacteria bacterium RIFCSPHIGHO2_12_FULL_63_22]